MTASGSNESLKLMASTPCSFVVQHPQQFDLKNAGQWPQWVQRFEDNSSASGLYAVKDKVLTQTLLHATSSSKHPDSLALGHDELGNYAKVKEKFDCYFEHPMN